LENLIVDSSVAKGYVKKCKTGKFLANCCIYLDVFEQLYVITKSLEERNIPLARSIIQIENTITRIGGMNTLASFNNLEKLRNSHKDNFFNWNGLMIILENKDLNNFFQIRISRATKLCINLQSNLKKRFDNFLGMKKWIIFDFSVIRGTDLRLINLYGNEEMSDIQKELNSIFMELKLPLLSQCGLLEE